MKYEMRRKLMMGLKNRKTEDILSKIENTLKIKSMKSPRPFRHKDDAKIS